MDNYNTELAVVAGMMRDNSKIIEVDLLPDEFAYQIPREIYIAIQQLSARNIPADVITVAEYMETTQPSGSSWFNQISHIITNIATVNVKVYAESVRDSATKRKAAQIANELMDRAEDGQEAVDDAIRQLMEIGRTKRKWEFSIKEALKSAVDGITERFESGGLSGIQTGISDIDNILGGLHKTDLIVIGARPAMGKTAFLLNMLIGADVPCGMISAEQGNEQIGTRVISISGKVDAQRIRKASMLDDSEFARITGACSRMMDKEIWINDMPAPSIQDVVRQARQWKFNKGIKALYIDYIQRIKGDKRLPKHEQVGEIAMTLKELARELDIPVIVLAQVNRQVEQRTNKRPNMSDLKDSGAIEQEADVVMTLYRDEVYNEETIDRGIIEIGIEKNRHGVIGMIKAAWRGEYLTVSGLDMRNNGNYE